MERKKKRLATPLKRKVHVKGRVWTYNPGYKTTILHPDRRRQWIVPDVEILGYSRSPWDDDISLPITPSDVKRWIEKNLEGE